MANTPRIPLALRLPNPPSRFFGRARELDWFDASWDDARTLVIWGAGGIGKSTLLLQALHTNPRVTRDLVVYVGLRAHSDATAPLLEVTWRTLCAALGYETSRSNTAPRDADTLLADVIDMADERGLCVVIDDAHLARPDELDTLLDAATRYARSSRWVVASRTAPDASSPDALLQLGPMDHEPLHQLAMHLSPHEDPRHAHRVTHAVAGSPWRLIQAMRKGLDHAGLTLDGFSEPTRDALRRMAALRLPLTDDALDACGVPHELIDELVRQSLVTRTLEGARLHDMARETLALAPSDWAEVVPELLSGLDGRTEPNARLERIRVAANAERDALANDELERSGELLIGRGFSAELWGTLHTHARPALTRWRIKSAHACGTAQAFDAIAHLEVPRDQFELRTLELHMMYRKERFVEAIEVAQALIADAEAAGERHAAMDARQILATLHLYTGDPARAEELLDQTTPTDDLQRNMAQVLKALLVAQRGDVALAASIADTLRNGLDTLARPLRAKVAFNVCLIDYRLQRFGAALDLFHDELDSDPLAFTMFTGRKSLSMGAALALQAADAELAYATLARVSNVRVAPSTQTRRTLLTLGIDQLDSGEVDLDLLRASTHDAVTRRAWDDASFGVALGARDALHRGEPSPPSSLPDDAAPTSNLYIAELLAEQSAWRHDGTPSPTDIPAHLLDYRKISIVAQATAAMRGGRDHGALWEARGLAHDERLHLIEFEAVALGCLWETLDAPHDARRWREALGALTSHTSSRRIDALAAFWEAASTRDVATLADLARARGGLARTCEAVRYAQALLALGEPTLDPLERATIQALRRELGWTHVSILGEPSTDRWIVDTTSKTVVSPHGEVAMGRHTTPWKMLEVLLDASSATKEHLVSEIWEVDEYHPLRHDNRLRLTARNLRRLVELDPKDHAWILTDEDGYRLGGSTVVLARAHPEAPRLRTVTSSS